MMSISGTKGGVIVWTLSQIKSLFFSPPVFMRGGLLSIAFCPSVFLGLWVQDYFVHHRPALCTTDLRCAPMSVRSGGRPRHSIFVVDNEHANQRSHCSFVPTYTLVVHNVALYRLGGAQDDFAYSFNFFLMVYNAVLSVSISGELCIALPQRYRTTLGTTNLRWAPCSFVLNR